MGLGWVGLLVVEGDGIRAESIVVSVPVTLSPQQRGTITFIHSVQADNRSTREWETRERKEKQWPKRD